jgi:hypothetical protein
VALAVALALLVSAALGPPAWAVMRYGPLQLSGNVDSLNLVRHSNPDKFQFIMNRNTLRLRVDFDWLQNGRLIDKFDLPFIERSKLFLLYRGVYDSFYDIAPGGPEEGQTRYDDMIGGPISGNRPGQCVGGPCPIGTAGSLPQLLPGNYSRLSDSNRSADKFQDQLREGYVDFKLNNAPLSFRIGRQQVIWGESDQFRVMDIINPLDETWHFQVESWDELRIPLWLGKGLWDIGELGPLSNTFLEVVYNPFDFQVSNTVDFLPRPWAVPFADPLRLGQINVSNGTLTTPAFNWQGTSYRRGDFQKNPQDASEVGVRFHAVTPQGFEFAFDYLYGRGRGAGGTNANAFKIEDITITNAAGQLSSISQAPIVGYYQPDPKNPGFIQPVHQLNVIGKMVYPYNHIFGMTGNYFEGDYTQSVLRYETLYETSSPFATTDPSTLVPVRAAGLPSQNLLTYGRSPLGFTKRDIWTGMAGFDRPTWIRFLNPKATWFLTAQFFWTYVTGNVHDLVGNGSPAGDYPYYGPVGKWMSGGFAGLSERQQQSGPGVTGNGDQWHRWEHLITFAGTSFYRSGTVVPFIANAWDPVNDSDEILWNVDYFYSNNFIISLQQKFFTTYGSKAPSNDNEYTAGRFDRRDETGLRLTYQF